MVNDMNKYMFSIIVLMLLLLVTSCSKISNPLGSDNPPDSQTSISPSGIEYVGDYTFYGKDGSLETGKLIKDDKGHIKLLPDRSASSYSNWWFDISVNYLNPRYYTPDGIPVYYLGDEAKYQIALDYKRGFPLNLYPILYAKMQTDQVYYPSLVHLPGQSIKIYDPLLIAPYGYVEINDSYNIPPGMIPGSHATLVSVMIEVLEGRFEFLIASGVGGMWDTTVPE